MNLITLFNRDNRIEIRLWTTIYRFFLGHLGKKSIISKANRILNPQQIFIGDGVAIRHDARLDVTREYSGQIYNGSIHIGDNTLIEPHVHIAAATTLQIGSNILMGSYIFITDHNHQFSDPILPVTYQPLDVATVCIEDFVWIGEKAIILKGVTVGHHAVIGANSVVTKSVPPYAVVAGSPAKILKMRPMDETSDL